LKESEKTNYPVAAGKRARIKMNTVKSFNKSLTKNDNRFRIVERNNGCGFFDFEVQCDGSFVYGYDTLQEAYIFATKAEAGLRLGLGLPSIR
jgi:hypothetical protein